MSEIDLADAEGSSRNFWIGFAFGWSAYYVLLVGAAVAQGMSFLPDAVREATVNVLPAVATTWIIAVNRHRLLRPEWSGWRTLLVHKVVGLTFALTTAALVLGLAQLVGGVPPEAWEGASPWVAYLVMVMISIFLYAMFIGIIMWHESIRRVRLTHAAMAREAVLRAEAEAKAVRAQFNPHFVFNTLHSLMLLVRADPDAAERAIEDVATLIRYASIIQRRDIDVVPLSKEVEVARRYVALEQLRLGDRLTVAWELGEGAASRLVPAFALQTLVENAIKHGIEPSAVGGTVGIETAVDGEVLTAVVSDDGPGADPDAVTKPGRGLELLTKRLQSRYGDSGTLRWETARDRGFTATMTIPAEAAPVEPSLDVIPSSDDRGDMFRPPSVAQVPGD